jgi:hypothetical protein
VSAEARPAFYALAPGGWRDYVTLLHPPYTLWHLSYVVVGAALAPEWRPGRLGLALVAFFLGLGIGAHALDELHGRPLGTGISRRQLIIAAALSIGAAMAAGLAYGGLRLLPFVLIGGLFVFGYNLELGGGVLHSDMGFAVTWGAFPVLVGAYAQHWTLPPAAWAAAVAALLMSLGQRSLSTPVRAIRRRVTQVTLQVTWRDGSQREYGRAELLTPVERALRALAWAVGALAVALVLAR